MKRLFILTAVVVLSIFALADDKFPPHAVKVTGTSDVNVVPDRAVIDIGVEKQNVSAAVAKRAADAASREILTALRNGGIPETDVKTNWLSLTPEYDYKSGRLTYFTAGQSLSVTVRDLAKLDSILDALIKAGGNRISSIQFETSELRKYRDHAREMAITAAREKADALAKALGQSIGKAIAVEEEAQSANPYGGLLANSTVSYGRVEALRSTTAAGERKVMASVTVWFELQ